MRYSVLIQNNLISSFFAQDGNDGRVACLCIKHRPVVIVATGTRDAVCSVSRNLERVYLYRYMLLDSIGNDQCCILVVYFAGRALDPLTNNITWNGR